MSEAPAVGRRIRIEGRVQGVFFRDGIRRLALQLGVSGWVRNVEDGSVEAHLEGPPDAVTRLIEFCRRGPSGARVDSVTVTESEPSGYAGFRIIR